ncbi:MAG: RDD family protein [Pyrinomonadaceae bacterium]
MPTSTSHEHYTAKTSSRAASEAVSSTLIEFPGVPPKPQWRKELSERVREIQQRRALEAAREGETATREGETATTLSARHAPVAGTPEMMPDAAAETSASPLGLVPAPPDAPKPNPLVVAALKRIERARQTTQHPPMPRASRGGAATAVARVAEESYQASIETAIAPEVVAAATAALPAQDGLTKRVEQAATAMPEKIEKPVEAARPAPLAIVPPTPATKSVEPGEVSAAKPRPRRHIPEVADESMLARLEAQRIAAVATLPAPELLPIDDHAPVSRRIAGGVIDLLVVVFASTPFAAIIELTNGNWADLRVAASMGGIVIVLMFIYLMAATALAGRTWGMSLVSLHTVDVTTGMAPTTGQCMRRAFGFMLSLATLGLGLLYALYDAEGRAAHDHLSGTIVISD